MDVLVVALNEERFRLGWSLVGERWLREIPVGGVFVRIGPHGAPVRLFVRLLVVVGLSWLVGCEGLQIAVIGQVVGRSAAMTRPATLGELHLLVFGFLGSYVCDGFADL